MRATDFGTGGHPRRAAPGPERERRGRDRGRWRRPLPISVVLGARGALHDRTARRFDTPRSQRPRHTAQGPRPSEFRGRSRAESAPEGPSGAGPALCSVARPCPRVGRFPSSSVPAEIYTTEPLGDSTILDLKVGDKLLKALVGASFEGDAGTKVVVRFPPERVHLFDRSSGLVIR